MTPEREQFLEKPLPSNPEAEKAILGGILLDNGLISEARRYLKPADFYSPIHRKVFAAMLVLAEKRKKIDPILIGEEIKFTGASLESIGGVATITNLTYGLPHFTNIAHYAEVVKEKSDLRTIINICNRATAECLAEDKPARKIASTVTSEMAITKSAVRKPSTSKEVSQKLRNRFESWINTGEKPVAVPSSIPELNAALRYGGYAKGDLILVCARPSIGKSAFMLDSIGAAALAGFNPLGFTLEMTEEDLAMRLIPQRAGIKNIDIKPSLYRRNPEVQRRIELALTEIAAMQFELDKSSMVIEELLATAEIAITQRGVGAIFLDYLQMIEATRDARRRDLELEQIAKMLKNFAVDFQVPVICLAQLNKQSELEDRRPEMQDIREAGATDQVADVILMPYRPGSRRKKKNEVASLQNDDESIVKVNIFIAKQRNGKAGFDIETDFDMDYQRFMSNELWNTDQLNRYIVE